MASDSESPLKRQREETLVLQDQENTKVEKDAHEQSQESKRQKSSYTHILSLLDEEEDEPTQDISSLITTLQQELSYQNTHFQENNPNTIVDDYTCDSSSSSHEEDDKGRVMRHLLEASDDELGLPNTAEQFSLDSNKSNVGEELFNANCSIDDASPFGDALWEIEDEAANYYTMLHSELFL